MLYSDFENIISRQRMNRYLHACSGNSRKAMTLYRKNLKLSQELFTVIRCFEIALRNKINAVYSTAYGMDWLRDAASHGGIFDNDNCKRTKAIILQGLRKLSPHHSLVKLLAEMDFGFWRYLFAQPQFHAGGKILLKVFPAKPTSTPAIQYNHSYVFNQLGNINELRPQLAHEPTRGSSSKIILSCARYRKYNNHSHPKGWLFLFRVFYSIFIVLIWYKDKILCLN